MEDSSASSLLHSYFQGRPTTKQLALEYIATVSSSVSTVHHLYVDGSLQRDGSTGCAIYSLDVEPLEGGWVGRRLLNSSNSTYCEDSCKQSVSSVNDD